MFQIPKLDNGNKTIELGDELLKVAILVAGQDTSQRLKVSLIITDFPRICGDFRP